MSGPLGSLRIIHVFRSPVGGLFRHVMDVVRGQIARGHQLGIICDSLTGGEHAATLLRKLSPDLALGLTRLPMPRQIGLSDLLITRHVANRVVREGPDVVHGHGAKGAAYARLAVSNSGPCRVYTPHGGSLLYRPGTAVSSFYLTLEKILRSRTDLFLFESAFIERLYRAKVGDPGAISRIVPNGVSDEEFAPVPLKPDATDLLYVGELRHLKGVDLLIDALAALRSKGKTLSATIVGDGRSRQELIERTKALALDDVVRFLPPTPAREAFALGRTMIVPSRAESFPYIVLEAAAAAKPLVVTNVGGIADMFGPYADRLIAPNDHDAIERALMKSINETESTAANARLLQQRIKANFSLTNMVDDGIAAYRVAIAARKG